MKMSGSEQAITYFTYEEDEASKVSSRERVDEVSVFVKKKVQRVDTKNTSNADDADEGKKEAGLQPNATFVSSQPTQECDVTRSTTKNASAVHQSVSQICLQHDQQSLQRQLQSSTKGTSPQVKQTSHGQSMFSMVRGLREAINLDDNKATSRRSGNALQVSNNVDDVRKEQNVKLRVAKLNENRDHDYSDLNQRTRVENLSNVDDDTEIALQDDSGAKISDKIIPVPTKERSKCQIKNINELKKATPCVKLLTEEVKSLCELKKINSQGKTFGHSKVTLLEESRQRLKKYCRTCAGLKIPLIDIFSEKGIQMRLSQQMKHLEEINQYDSLSTQMCMDCICDLKMSYKFFMQIKKAEVKLRSIHATLNDTLMNEHKTKTLEMDKARLLDSLTVDCQLPEKSFEQIKSSPHSIKSEDKYESMAEMSEIVSLQDHNSTTVIPPRSNVETHFELKVIKSEPEAFEEVSVVRHSDDNDSIEEFDPDDPLFQPDSSDVVESDEEPERSNSQTSRIQIGTTVRGAKHLQGHDKSLKRSIETDLGGESGGGGGGGQITYEYDVSLKSCVSAEVTADDENRYDASHTIRTNIEVTSNSEQTNNDGQRQPNILKRKLPSLAYAKVDLTAEVNENDDTLNVVATSGGSMDSKMQKLNVQNALCIGSAEEKGIMYVTVKGTKPNELLLVKVKKMDKPIDKKDEKNPGKRLFDFKPVEKALKKYESLTLKDKDLFADRVKKSDKREQIIEEQIEEYKKKREKILGGTVGSVPSAMMLDDGFVRFVKSSENQGSHKRSMQMVPAENNVDTKKEVFKVIEEDEIKVENEEESSRAERAETLESKSAGDKTYVNTEEYLARLSRLKQKWEEAKKTRESLQRELDQSYTEGNMEKLGRILGEREKNLQDFQDYLKQRKIVITRLKDEDIISLYEDRSNTNLKKSFPDLIDEAQPADYIPQQNYLECDYCPQTFASKETLEEHLKTHDYKIMHYCEDCTEEFTTNKAKRNHNGACIMKLICKHCNSLLDSKGKKRQHEQKHCDNMYGQLCDICGEKFKHQGTLDQHVKTQHMSWEKIFQCPKCPKKFAFKQKLSFHLKSVHTTLRAYLCEDCGADFKNPASLRHHRIRKHQPVGNKRECPVCHKLVPFYSLSKHMHTHKAYTIQCPHCDKMFKNSSTLKQHVRIHEDQRQYRCDTCGVGFNRRDGLRLHMRVHEKTDSRGLKECSCQVCGEKFPNHSMLVIHRNRVHKDGRQYTCHICNRSMISTRSLEWHMSHIHNETVPGIAKEETDAGAGAPEKKRVSCYHCNKTFKTEMILRTHIKNTHMEKDPVKCPDCEQTFTSEVRLRHHMMVAHNRLEGTLACPHCPKRFVNQLRLKTHMISHSEERPYTCEICGFNLKTKIQLIKHHQNRHSNERPLQCKYCPWRCKQVSALVCHERTHTNERPYSCSVCRQRFKYLGDKNKHERRHESLGGAGFKRIVTGRNTKQIKIQEEDTSCSEQEQEEFERVEAQLGDDERYDGKFEEEEMVKFEAQEMGEEYEQAYEQEYEETSREASEAAEVIMSMEDTTVYTEEVTADNIESAEMITDDMMTSQILQSGTVVHLQQQDDSGKIQVIPVMLSLPDLSDTSAEVNLATASIMYNN